MDCTMTNEEPLFFFSINREYQSDLDFKGLTMSDPVGFLKLLINFLVLYSKWSKDGDEF